MPVTILAKPSDHIEAYFENTEGLVEGVDKAFYSGKIAVREVQSSAKRAHTEDTTAYTVGKRRSRLVEMAQYGNNSIGSCMSQL